MIKNYFILAWRNLWKNKISTSLNLICLAVGMSCCMLIMIYVNDELSFNTFNKKINNIYRVNWTSNNDGKITPQAITPIALAPAIQAEIPQVQAVTRFYQRSGGMETTTQNKAHEKFHERNVYFSDNSLFTIFSISFLRGSQSTALSSPNSIVLTDEMAQKYFGDENPLGKTLLYDAKIPVQVSAVVNKLPVNSDLQFDFLVSFETLYSVETPEIASYLKNDWTFNPAYTFCLLKAGQQPKAIEEQLNRVLQKYGDERKNLFSLSLQALDDIHLHAAALFGNPSTGSIRYIYIVSAIAFLLLLIANVNFINLATARASTRTREVGMRRVLGAERKQLVVQFLSEAVLLSFAAFFLALICTWLALPLLNQLTDKTLSNSAWLQPRLISLFLFIFFCTGIVSGLYPAFFITRFKTILALKGRSGETGQRTILRKVLLVTQFSISAFLIIGAMVIYRQLEFMRNKPLGFRKEQVLVVPIFGSNTSVISFGVDGPMRQRMNAFSHELSRFSRVKAVTAASALPGQGYITGLIIPEGFAQKDNMFAPWVSVDYNFISTMGIKLVAGRDFSKSTGTDHINAFIISESAVRTFGWKNPAEAIGKTMIRGDEANGKKGQVIGVVSDYIFNPLDQPMEPLIMDVAAVRFTQFAVTLQPDHLPETVAAIQKTWNDFFPERVFEYSFLDSDINSQYRSNEQLSKLIGYFAAIAILLSCLGLFSLASFLSVQRSREIGIRKVLGASLASILALLSGDFLKMVLVALAITSPIAWYVMNKWLQNYAYRITLSWWIFLAAGAAIILLTTFTVVLQSIKTALINPVKSLKTDA